MSLKIKYLLTKITMEENKHEEVMEQSVETNASNTTETPILETKEEVKESQITELKEEKPKMQEFIEFIRDLIIIIFVVIVIRTYFVAPFQIKWTSMENSYHDREFILVNKFSYANEFNLYIWNPNRWDVVIFRPHAANGKEYYIKRVIWLPWEKIKFDGWEVYVKANWKNDYIKLNEDYLSPLNKWKTFLPLNIKEQEFEIPKWEYFLMWDNRNNSSDSRSCFMSCTAQNSSHFAKRNDIVWMVLMDFWYLNIFKTDDSLAIWNIHWVSEPRFLNTPKTWEYKELQ